MVVDFLFDIVLDLGSIVSCCIVMLKLHNLDYFYVKIKSFSFCFCYFDLHHVHAVPFDGVEQREVCGHWLRGILRFDRRSVCIFTRL